MKDSDLVDIITLNPGISSGDIWRQVQSRSRAAGWFGAESFLTEVFGTYFATVTIALERLERQGLVASRWGPPSSRYGNRRSRLYWVVN